MESASHCLVHVQSNISIVISFFAPSSLVMMRYYVAVPFLNMCAWWNTFPSFQFLCCSINYIQSFGNTLFPTQNQCVLKQAETLFLFVISDLLKCVASLSNPFQWTETTAQVKFLSTSLLMYGRMSLVALQLLIVIHYTGLFKMIVGVLTTCHTQYTWDRRICIFFI
jgi:hypothetical protein